MNYLNITIVLCASAVLVACTQGTGSLVSNTTQVAAPEPTQALAFKANKAFGKTLNADERRTLSSAEKQALNYGKAGEEINWKGESSNTSAKIIAFQLYKVGTTSCRRFELNLTTSAGLEISSGTACFRGNGVWQLVN